jgi:hypothetical protein
LLLRSDLHTLFDHGYLTVDPVWSNYSGGAGIVSEQAAEPRIATDGSIN